MNDKGTKSGGGGMKWPYIVSLLFVCIYIFIKDIIIQ